MQRKVLNWSGKIYQPIGMKEFFLPVDYVSFFISISCCCFYRTVFSPKTSRIQPSMCTGLVPSESTSVQPAADAGISLLTVLSAHLPCQLMVLCICGRATAKICIASEILRGTVTTSTKARCAWDSGLVIVLVVLRLTPTQAGSPCPGSLLKKSLNLRLRS